MSLAPPHPAADSFLAASVPPPAAALQLMQEQMGSVQEVDAVEAALLQVLHRLPPALAAAGHFPHDVPLLLRLAQVGRGGGRGMESGVLF
jgi:hypothetical protein